MVHTKDIYGNNFIARHIDHHIIIKSSNSGRKLVSISIECYSLDTYFVLLLMSTIDNTLSAKTMGGIE